MSENRNENKIKLSPKHFCPVGSAETISTKDLKDLKLFVGHLPKSVSSQELYKCFKQFGDIIESVVIPDRFRTESRGYGFVVFKHKESARKATLANVSLKNNKLDVRFAWKGEKPRRAKFNVKHGSKNGRQLFNTIKTPPKISYGKNTKRNQNLNNSFNTDRSKTDSTSKLTHSNFTVYRTANIQPIEAVTLNSMDSKSPMKNKKKSEFPNSDIKRDFRNLLKKNLCKNGNNIKIEKVLKLNRITLSNVKNKITNFVNKPKIGSNKPKPKNIIITSMLANNNNNNINNINNNKNNNNNNIPISPITPISPIGQITPINNINNINAFNTIYNPSIYGFKISNNNNGLPPKMTSVSNLATISNMATLNTLNTLNSLNKISCINQTNKLKQINELKQTQINKLKLNQLRQMQQIEKLKKLQELNLSLLNYNSINNRISNISYANTNANISSNNISYGNNNSINNNSNNNNTPLLNLDINYSQMAAYDHC